MRGGGAQIPERVDAPIPAKNYPLRVKKIC